MILFELIWQVGSAQLSNFRERQIRIEGDTLVLDSLVVIPRSLIVRGDSGIIASSLYQFSAAKSLLVFDHSYLGKSVHLSYRVFPSSFVQTYSHKDISRIQKAGSGNFVPYVIGSDKKGEDLLGTGVQKSGSVSRGVTFGNSQNLTVNSSLNLQLSGQLNERMSILASITDDNIPIQPNGNSAQLQDFDQVFIQVSDDKTRLVAGDFILRRPAGYFLNYFKRAQGAYFFSSELKKDKSGTTLGWSAEASASISKGRFARNSIQGIEGNQGPYRLRGTDGELYIIVLAGTEAVYIDGKQLERGQDKDYVIDYNAAEIVFTPRQFITKDRRIVVEFQYSEKRYARPMMEVSLTKTTARTKLYFNAYSESDAKNQPLQQDLTDQDKAILALAGDNLLKAVRSGVDSVAFSSSLVLYSMEDSLGFDSVFVYSIDSAMAHYKVGFSLVGQGNGDYLEDGFTANGKKYKWIAPTISASGIVHNGSYSPVILLATPKKNQMVVFGMEELFPSKKRKLVENKLQIEGAMSNKDLNTFSNLDSRDDLGFAVKTGWTYKRRSTEELKKVGIVVDTLARVRKSSLSGSLNYEYVGQSFSRIERYREVEFERNWNILNRALTTDQHWTTIEGALTQKGLGSASLGGDLFVLGSDYVGRKAKFNTDLKKPKWSALTSGSYLETTGDVRSRFIRHKANVTRIVGKVKLGFKDEQEYNTYFLHGRDSLASNSYRFYDWQVSAGTADSSKTQFSVYYRERRDGRPDSTGLSTVARAEEYGGVFSRKASRDNRINLTLSNRRLFVVDPERFTQSPENTLLSRLEHTRKWKNGFVQSTTFYEVGSGLEQKKEFVYLEVQPGQGTYIWIDYNGNGVKELNEFEVAQFSYEANYIRSFVQSNEYVRTYTNQFSQTLQISPDKILKKSTKSQRFFKRFSDQISYKVDRKTTRENKDDRFNPFLTAISDSTLMSLNSSLRNVLFFNKTEPRFGMDFTTQQIGSKVLLSNGFESRGDNFNQVGVRWNFYRAFTLTAEVKDGRKSVKSDFLSGRNYLIKYQTVKPKLTWQPSTTSRYALLGEYSQKTNIVSVVRERAEVLKIGAEITLNSAQKGSVQLTMNYIKIDYSGVGNSSLSFDMLEGLAKGVNYTWGATIQRTVAKNLQLNLTYNGRKPDQLAPIHTGGVQLRAFF